jgi:hypothetical protein
MAIGDYGVIFYYTQRLMSYDSVFTWLLRRLTN